MKYTKVALLGLAMVSSSACNPACNEFPEACYDSSDVVEEHGGRRIIAPDHYQRDIRDHILFLRKLSGVGVDDIHQVIVYDPSRKGCSESVSPKTFQLLNNHMASADISCGDVRIRELSSNRFLPFPYLNYNFGQLDLGTAREVAHETGHLLFYADRNHNSIFQYWNSRGLIHRDNRPYNPESMPLGNNPESFEEYFVDIYASIAQYAYILQLDFPSSPFFDQFLLPLIQDNGIDIRQALQRIRSELMVSIELREKTHDLQLDDFIRRGYIDSSYSDALQYDVLVPSLHAIYNRWQEHALDVISSMPAP